MNKKRKPEATPPEEEAASPPADQPEAGKPAPNKWEISRRIPAREVPQGIVRSPFFRRKKPPE